MDIDEMNIITDEIGIEGSGRLPRFNAGDDPEWWIGQTRKLGQVKLKARCSDVNNCIQKSKFLEKSFSELTLRGPVEFEMEYTGQEDLGRFDLEALMKGGSQFGVKNYFEKPDAKEFQVSLQTIFPWDSEHPSLWIYSLIRCGEAEFLNEKPIKLYWSFQQDKTNRIFLNLAGEMTGEFRNLDHAVRLSPILAKKNAEKSVQGSVDIEGKGAVNLELVGSSWKPRQIRAGVTLSAKRAAIDIPGNISKSLNEPFSLSTDYKFVAANRLHHLSADILGGELSASVQMSRREKKNDDVIEGSIEFHSDELSEFFKTFPIFSPSSGNTTRATGKIQGRCGWTSEKENDQLFWNVDASDSALVVDGKTVKLPGVQATFEGKIQASRTSSDNSEHYSMSNLSLNLGESFIRLRNGKMKIQNKPDSRWIELIGFQPWLAIRYSPLETLEMDMDGRIDVENELFLLNPDWQKIIRKNQITGSSDIDIQLRLEKNRFKGMISSRADNLGVQIGQMLNKHRESAAGVDMEFFIWPEKDDPSRYHYEFDPISFQLGEMKGTCKTYGEFKWKRFNHIELGDGMTRIEIFPTDLNRMGDMSRFLARSRSSGNISGQFCLERKNHETRFGTSDFFCDHLSGEFLDQPIMVDGMIHFSSDSTSCDRLILTAGSSTMETSWLGYFSDGGLTGKMDVSSKYIDSDQLKVIFSSLFDEENPKAQSTTKPAIPTSTATSMLSDDGNRLEIVSSQEEAMRSLHPILEFASKSDILATLKSDVFLITDPRSGVSHKVKDLHCQLDVGKSPDNHSIGSISFFGGISKGIMKGDFSAVVDEDNPPVVLESALDQIEMSPSYKPLVENFFPGLVVNDRISIFEKTRCLMFATEDAYPNYVVGEGKMIFLDGCLEGQAAPDWVVKIFPGLNFTRYNFSRMYNWFTKQSDGVVHNNMIFVGHPWNIYIEGDSLPDGHIRYEIGVDVLARYESEYWSSVGQGRVPIFTTKGKIVAGKIQDQVVQYVPPHEAFYRVFVKNNAITGAYRLLMRQINGDSKEVGK
jgi:hypothetical protein